MTSALQPWWSAAALPVRTSEYPAADSFNRFARGRSVIIATHSPVAIAWADSTLRLPAGHLHHDPRQVRA